MKSVLIANRGEVALRVLRAAADRGLRAVAVYAEDDGDSMHVLQAEHAVNLGATGPAAYLDINRMIEAAEAEGCDAIHPGYGFLSESAAFARACTEAGIKFVGPRR